MMLVQDSVIDQLHELTFEYLSIHAHTVGFPELALPILMEVHNVTLLCLLCLTVCYSCSLCFDNDMDVMVMNGVT